jgi:hypothetical protein
MDDALLKLKEFKMRSPDRLKSRGRGRMIDDLYGPITATAAMLVLLVRQLRWGTFKPKLKKEIPRKRKKKKDMTETEGSFKKGGMIKSGKPKIAKKGWR